MEEEEIINLDYQRINPWVKIEKELEKISRQERFWYCRNCARRDCLNNRDFELKKYKEFVKKLPDKTIRNPSDQKKIEGYYLVFKCEKCQSKGMIQIDPL